MSFGLQIDYEIRGRQRTVIIDANLQERAIACAQAFVLLG
jgi:hypothetical protein